jgi:hypothetical protein
MWARFTPAVPGIRVAQWGRMQTRTSTPKPTNRCLLRWVLQRGTDALACEVDTHGDRAYDLQVVLGWNDAPALSEHFNNPVAAMERHAQVTALLRDAGWIVAEHTVAA